MKAVLAPTAPIQPRTFLAMNSAPLSDLMNSGGATQDEQVCQGVDVGRIQLPIDTDHQRLLRELVDDVERAERPPVMRPVLDEVTRPDVVRAHRPEPDAGPVAKPQPALPGLFLRDVSRPSRRHIRSTRLWFTCHPALFSSPVIIR